jgi:hypothetical protein
MHSNIREYFEINLVPISESLKLIQNANGSIVEGKEDSAIFLLKKIKNPIHHLCSEIDNVELYEAVSDDIDKWIENGVGNQPFFNRVRETYKAVENQRISFFWGPTIMANSGEKRGHYLEGFLVFREEPKECKPLYDAYPHPKNICQSCHILSGTSGFYKGNCLVFFPENIKANGNINQQKYAVFFFNKFYNIYNRITLPTVKKLINNPSLESESLSKRDTYIARCIWGYLHDYYHHCGAKPFDENIFIKTRWAVGVLEEIKVDMKTLKTCLEDDIPFGKSIAEYILYERIFRYPQEEDYANNFDSATGFFLLSWLENNNVLTIQSKSVEIDWDLLPLVIPTIVELIETIEEEMINDTIIEKSNELLFSYLDIPSKPNTRFQPSKNISADHLLEVYGNAPPNINMVDLSSIEYDGIKEEKNNASIQ